MGKKALRAVEEKKELLQQFMVDKILRGAAGVFGQSGYHGATVEEMARETSVSVGTIYQYFDNKYDLYIKVLNFFMDSLMESIQEAIRGVEEPQRRLEGIITEHIRVFEENPDFFRIYLAGKHDWIIDPIDEPKGNLAERYTGYIKILSDSIDELIDSQVFVRVNSEKAAYYLLEMAYSVVFQRVTGYSVVSRVEDTQMMLMLMMEGFMNREKKYQIERE